MAGALAALLPAAPAGPAEPPGWVGGWVAKHGAGNRKLRVLLELAAGRCADCSVDQLAAVVLPPIEQRREEEVAAQEENRFEVAKLRRAVARAAAKAEAARTQQRARHHQARAAALQLEINEREVADAAHVEALAQLVPLRALLRQIIKRRLTVDAGQLQRDVDSILSLGLSGADAALEGSGSVLHAAAERGELEGIRGWLSQQAGDAEGDGGQRVDVDARAPSGATPLHVAAYFGHCDVVALLLQRRADVDARREDGTTPLHAAAKNGHLEVVEALVGEGADLSRAAKRGVTPLAMILAGLQRARLRAERLDADGAELGAELATVLPLPSNELNKGLAAIGDKRAGWELLRMLEKTLRRFLQVGAEAHVVKDAAVRFFRGADKDASGRLSARELSKAFARTGISQASLVCPSDSDGGVGFADLWRWWWVRHKSGLPLPAGPAPARGAARTEHHRAAFVQGSVEALWRARKHTAMVAVLEGIVRKCRLEAMAIEKHELQDSERREAAEYRRQQQEWIERMKRANAETRRKQEAVWGTEEGGELLQLLDQCYAAQLLTPGELGALKLEVQAGADLAELQRHWTERWRVHVTHKGLASAGEARRKLRAEKATREEPAAAPPAAESAGGEAEPSRAPWFDESCRMWATCKPTAQHGDRDHYDRRQSLRRGARLLVAELAAESLDSKALAVGGLAHHCRLNDGAGLEARRICLGAARQLVALLLASPARQSDPRAARGIDLACPALLAMLVYHDQASTERTVAKAIEDGGGLSALVALVAHPRQETAILSGALLAVGNLASCGCRHELVRLGAPALVRPLCLAAGATGALAQQVSELLNAPERGRAGRVEDRRTGATALLASPEVQRARADLLGRAGPSSDEGPSAVTTAAAARDRTKLDNALRQELPYLKTEFSRLAEAEIEAILRRNGGITDSALAQLAMRDAQRTRSQKPAGESDQWGALPEETTRSKPGEDEAVRETDAEPAPWSIDDLGAFQAAVGGVAEPAKHHRAPRSLCAVVAAVAKGKRKHHLKEIFEQLDVEGDGLVSTYHLHACLQSLGRLTRAEATSIVNAILLAAGAVQEGAIEEESGEVRPTGIGVGEAWRAFQQIMESDLLSDDEKRTLRWHTQPEALARRRELDSLRQQYGVLIPKLAPDEELIDGLGQAILAERDKRLEECVADGRARVRTAVEALKSARKRTDDMWQAHSEEDKAKASEVDRLDASVYRLQKELLKISEEISWSQQKLKSVTAASTASGFVWKVDSHTSAGHASTPALSSTVVVCARRYLELGEGRLQFSYGTEELLTASATMSEAATNGRDASGGGAAGLRVVVDEVPPWLARAREKLEAESRDFESALSPLESPLSTHKSNAQLPLSPLVSPQSPPTRRGQAASPTRAPTISVTRSKARGGEGSPSPMLWNSPLQAARSGEVLAVADLASSTCAPEPSLSASHAREAAEYAEEMERRELAKQQALQEDKPMPRFDAIELKKLSYPYAVRVTLGSPDSVGGKGYLFAVDSAAEQRSFMAAIDAGIAFNEKKAFYDERSRSLVAKRGVVAAQLAHWQKQRSMLASEGALLAADRAADLDAADRGEDLAAWHVADVASAAAERQRQIRSDVLPPFPSAFWGASVESLDRLSAPTR